MGFYPHVRGSSSRQRVLCYGQSTGVEQQLKHLQHLQHRSISTAVVVTTVSDGVYSTLPPRAAKKFSGAITGKSRCSCTRP